ncbi:conserved hypothetical protein [Nautilia profundicola AmH]|uniref:Uncharacterized protein n=1 Tax=Nautilia profundicola (strain ATCC BAA-1463 / DSM 18972 / AmH) TaxID=598659 RepID=B9L8D1_NAUPA|nr:hypothetical protein [Nautilia profundicola]ACM93219.1 conserved hypothetical protein [Nautilia profundicola AmH]
MNANDFFEQYSIEIINKRTRISPISLRYIKNKEFEKIQRVKFLGFIRIIEKEFNVDLSELIEEYNEATNHTHTQNSEIELEEPKKHNTLLLFILAVILFSLGAYLLYNKYGSVEKENLNEINKTAFMPPNTDENITETAPETKLENNKQNISMPESSHQTVSKKTTPQEKAVINNTKNSQNTKTIAPKTVEIYPNERVWFKAINLDTNKTVEYLTSNPKTLIGANWYVKFGHGNITINYGNQTITPETKKITRILFKNGKVEYLKKPNRYEK